MDLLLLGAAIVVTFLVFTWLVKVVKATVKTAFLVAIVLFGFQFIGIGPEKITQEIGQIGQFLWQLVQGR
ncbi:hypothetical protein [Myxacorys almedinensis]|uniref:Uncharacterized protein n=1 Tax=Myxacorys almedinensis A TaxID=2690445 RepID=A0A8J7Z3M8_9CYAN|nr:hypothetical protein [Myxacorys almedinensis]NDJ17513.1 hypothetical protein [Myxacorys almedinensis A]